MLLRTAGLLLAAALAAPLFALGTFELNGPATFFQDLDELDGVDYTTEFEGSFVVLFTVPPQSGLTLTENVINQGGPRSTYSGATINSVVLNRAGGPLTLISTPTAASLRLWDRTSFAGGTDYFILSTTLPGGTTIEINLSARIGVDTGYGTLFTRGSPNTLDSDFLPTFSSIAERDPAYFGFQFTVDGQTPAMPGRGRYFGSFEYFGTPGGDPPDCVADFDDGSGTGTPDGGVGIEDLLYYLQLFEEGGIEADVDDGSGTGVTDGGVGIEDLLYYLVRFENGC